MIPQDVHAFLDNLKAPIELVNHRVTYYAFVLTAALRSIGVPLDKLEFVTGSSYQYSPDYSRDLFKLSSITSENDAKRAGAEVVKQTSSPPLSGLLYPLLQALDEEYLGVDIQFGGVDQRKIFILAELALPKLGLKKRAHLMNAMVPGLAGGKMSSSDPNSKIDFMDSPAEVKKKIKAAVAAPGVVEDNGLLAFVKAVVDPIAKLQIETASKGNKSPFVKADAATNDLFTIVRPEQYGGILHFASYEQLEAAYAKEEVHPGDLKGFVTEAINTLLAPIQEEFRTNADFQAASLAAYPPPPEPEKKKKVNKKHRLGEEAQPIPTPQAKDGVDGAVANQTDGQQEGQAIDLATVKAAIVDVSQ